MSLTRASSNLTLSEKARLDSHLHRKLSKRSPLQKDRELWDPEGDCFIHLYAEGQSLRGPAFRVSRTVLLEHGCSALMRNHGNVDPQSVLQESVLHIFLPPPNRGSRAGSYKYHCTTRNVFRCLLQKPLVGECTGPVLIDIAERLRLWNGSIKRTLQFMTQYMSIQNYSTVANRPKQALALLQFAEHFKLGNLWKTAFTHCVGMFPRVKNYAQFRQQSQATQEAFSVARTEMEIRLETARSLLMDFDTLPLDLHHNLSLRQYQHIEGFAEFLNKFSTGLGANQRNRNFDRSLYMTLRSEFQSLYDYLADLESNIVTANQLKKASKGAVFNLVCFDTKNQYTPLPYTLPILPSTIHRRRSTWSNNALTESLLSFGKNTAQTQAQQASAKSLSNASNSDSNNFGPSFLIGKYLRFQQQCLSDQSKLSSAEVRLLDWTVIYAVLQTLIWATSGPDNVMNDMAKIDYPVCCNVPKILPWKHPLYTPVLSQSRPSSIVSYSSSLPLDLVPTRTSSQYRIKHTQHKKSLSDPFPISQRHVEITVPGYGNGIHTHRDEGTRTSSSAGSFTHASGSSARELDTSSERLWINCSSTSASQENYSTRTPTTLPSLYDAESSDAASATFDSGASSASSVYSRDSSGEPMEPWIDTDSVSGDIKMGGDGWEQITEEIESMLSKVTLRRGTQCILRTEV